MRKLPLHRRHARHVPGTGWFDDARLGMFVHWGLYSLLGRGEWVMFNEKLKVEKYNKLIDRFTASAFDADQLVSHARACGAGYVVLTARHHDGFCLWDTATSEFKSTLAPARRDIIGEYTAACRRAGLRVGIYFSLMSWQHPALHKGPLVDPTGWKVMVDETHAQVRELMSRYGPIDLLWYDGGFVPGLGDAQLIAQYWRATELNAMVRTLQPGILINNRSGLDEDFSTPEQHIVAPSPGRRWEACMTLNDHWGYCKSDRNCKPLETLLDLLRTCARFGGNLLLNVGPDGAGRVPRDSQETLKELGEWMATNGQSIRGSQRSRITEADLGPCFCTAKDKRIFLHVAPNSPRTISFGLRNIRVRSARILGATAIEFSQSSSGIFTVQVPTSPLVIELQCASAAAKAIPASVIAAGQRARKLTSPVAGTYSLELLLAGEQPGNVQIKIGARPTVTGRIFHGRIPETIVLNNLALPGGFHRVQVTSRQGRVRLLGLQLKPHWRQIDSTCWQTIGPFQSGFGVHQPVSEVKKAMLAMLGPQKPGPAGRIEDALGRAVCWRSTRVCRGEHARQGVDFPHRISHDYIGVCFARTIIICPDDRVAQLEIACDWWANAWINGKPVKGVREAKAIKEDGCQFNGWKPQMATIRLRRGANELLFKCHPGTAANWFTCRISDPGDLKIVPQTPAQ